jgi:Tol biopolymer transport system component
VVPTPTPTITPTPTLTFTPTPERVVESQIDAPGSTNRIAYVNRDNQIFTVKPDGSDPVLITPPRPPLIPGQPDFFYTWPGWSPDSQRIVFSVAISPTGGGAPYLLMEATVDGSRANFPNLLFQNEPGTNTIVSGGPHYALWSPDSKKVSAIVSTSQGQAIILSDTVERSTLPLVLGAPLYLGWSPDSEQILIHAGESLLLFEAPFTSDGGETLAGSSPRYLTPQFAPNDNRAAYVVDSEDGATLNIQDASGRERIEIVEVGALLFFRWSPSGEQLAMIKGDPLADAASIWLAAADGSSEEEILEGRYRMIMWSPDGSKLLLALVDEDDPAKLHWSVINVQSREITELVSFTPSNEILQFHFFFDQYSSSHTFWSPDSQSLVFTGEFHDSSILTAMGPIGRDAIWTVDVSGTQAPTLVAEGKMAFWSPD